MIAALSLKENNDFALPNHSIRRVRARSADLAKNRNLEKNS
jgi:hypothetical protein